MAGQLRLLGNTELSDLVQETWDSTLRMQSNPDDIFGAIKGLYSDENRTLPDSVIMKIPFKPGVYKTTIALLMNLSGPGVAGETEQLNNEVTQVLKYFTAYSQDYSQAVNSERYGIHAHTKEVYGLLKAVNPQLSKWHQEKEGQKARQALLERVDDDLTLAPVSRSQHWNKNVLVKNVGYTDQPAYSTTLSTFTENIGDAIETAGSTAGTADWDMDLTESIMYFASTVWELEPYIDNRYIVTVPAFQASLLKKLSSSGSQGNIQKDSFLKEISQNAWKFYLGTVGPLDLYEDKRAPVLQRTGTNGSYALTSYYRGMGTDDDRPTTGTNMDVGFVMGKSALVMAEHEPLHYEEELRNYGKRRGVAAIRGMAYQALEYDIGANMSATSRRNQNSAVVLARRTTATA